MFQDKEVEEIERVLNNDFENICNWFVDNKLSIHFGEDKTKSILFASQRKIKTIKKLIQGIKKMEYWSFFTGQIVFWHLGFEECYTMPSYNHILIMHAPRGTLTLLQSLKQTANNAK